MSSCRTCCPTNDASPCRNVRRNNRRPGACRLAPVSSRRRRTVRWDLVEIACSHGCAWCFVILASAWGGRDQLHDLLDIFLHTLKFPACQIELSPGPRNLRVGSDGSYVFYVDMNQFAARFSQFDPNDRFARDATTERGTLCQGSGERSLLLGREWLRGIIDGPGTTVRHHRHRALSE